MRLLVLILVLIMCLPAVAFASPQNATAGPFKITFDLNNVIIQPQYSRTCDTEGISVVDYSIKIIDPNSPAECQVSINKYSAPIPDSIEYTAESIAEMYRVIYRDVTVDYRSIDGKDGYDVKGADDEHGRLRHSAGYQLGEQIQIAIGGDLTDFGNLLDTIHIESMP